MNSSVDTSPAILRQINLDPLINGWDHLRIDHLHAIILRLAAHNNKHGSAFLEIENDCPIWIGGPALLGTFAYLCFRNGYIKKSDFRTSRNLMKIFYKTFLRGVDYKQNENFFSLKGDAHTKRLQEFDDIFANL